MFKTSRTLLTKVQCPLFGGSMRFRCSSPCFLILICVHCVVSCSVPNIPLNALPLVAPALSLLLVQKKFCTRCLPLTPLPSSLLHFCSHSPPCSLCFLDQPPNVCTRDGICNVSSAHPLVPPLIHLRHGSIALPMCGALKMYVGVSLPHFTSPRSNGGQIGILPSVLAPTLKKQNC